MKYVLGNNTLSGLHQLREKYQTEEKVNLNISPSMFGLPTQLGGTDIKSRKSQIDVIERFLVVFANNIHDPVSLKDESEWQSHVTASRAMIAICLYVQEQIDDTYKVRSGKNSTLNHMIDKVLGINSDNFIDADDKEMCFLALNRLLHTPKAFEEANAQLNKAKLKPFTEKEWRDIKYYASTHCNHQCKNFYSDYPITSITKPVFGAAFALAGMSAGSLVGGVFGASTSIQSAQYKLTAIVGGNLILFGFAGPTGVAIFAPVIASKLISSFCSISLASVLGSAMGLIGQGVGITAGIPLDLACKLVSKAFTSIGCIYSDKSEEEALSGIRIADGVRILQGIVLEPIKEDQPLPEADKLFTIEIKDDGQILMNGQPIEAKTCQGQPPPELIEQLKGQLAQFNKQQNPENSPIASEAPGQALV